MFSISQGKIEYRVYVSNIFMFENHVKNEAWGPVPDLLFVF